jgi:hypothetical protein
MSLRTTMPTSEKAIRIDRRLNNLLPEQLG